MKLIRYTGRREAQNGQDKQVDTGIFHCVHCGNDVDLPVASGRRKGHCGCQTGSQKGPIYRPKPAERTCLMCGKNFVSRGPHNRRCVACECKIEASGQAYYMPPVHKQRDHSVVAECSET